MTSNRTGMITALGRIGRMAASNNSPRYEKHIVLESSQIYY
jgi:hypothetical protein